MTEYLRNVTISNIQVRPGERGNKTSSRDKVLNKQPNDRYLSEGKGEKEGKEGVSMRGTGTGGVRG